MDIPDCSCWIRMPVDVHWRTTPSENHTLARRANRQYEIPLPVNYLVVRG